MLKNLIVFATAILMSFYMISSFAIGPGAAQAQIQNNARQMQQNKQIIQQNQQLLQQRNQVKKIKPKPAY
jgi:hypothetical protein